MRVIGARRLAVVAALAAGPAAAGNIYVPLTTSGATVPRTDSRVTSGVPLPRGRVRDLSDLRIVDSSTAVVRPAQFTSLATWPDGSQRWVLCDFASSRVGEALALTQDPYTPVPPAPGPLVVTTTATEITVATGSATFVVARQGFRPFVSASLGAQTMLRSPGADLVLTRGGTTYRASLDTTSTVDVEEAGPMRVALRAEGTFRDAAGTSRLGYTARLHFNAGVSYARLLITLQNGNAAIHPGNVWDLGSSGSRDIDDLSLELPLALGAPPTYTAWGESPTARSGPVSSDVEIYQESSGGARWNWRTHVNRANVVPMTFRGYELREGGAAVASGNRARGYLDLSDASAGVTVGVRQFWQNFPKAVRGTAAGMLTVGLFPDEFPDVHEIQGGEAKTHEVLIWFHAGDASFANPFPVMEDLANPLRARPGYAEAARTEVLGNFGPRDPIAFPDWENTIEYIAFDKGDRSFFTQREAIDEFGWRNFGDAFADHETDCGFQAWDVPISHDNNQYDYNWAALMFWIRNGEREWLDLGTDGSRHLMDIDVYHTDADVAVYNRGAFWHTTHDVDAETSTHRTWSSRMSPACTPYLSGGPALGHLYTEGLLLHGYLTGERRAFEVHAELESYLATRYGIDAPGPGSGYEVRAWANGLRAAVAGHRRTGDPSLYALAVQIVRDSDAAGNPSITGTNFGDSMLMVALGRFLDLKRDRGELADADAAAAADSLAELARRVRTNYAPRRDVLDFRYSEGVWYAYKYAAQSDPDKGAWAGLGSDFFTEGERTGFFNIYINNKNLAHTASNGQLHTYFMRGRIPLPVNRLLAVKSGADVDLSWDGVAIDIHDNPVAIGEYRVHRAADRPTRFTDVPRGSTPLTTYRAGGDVPGPRSLYFYEVRAVANPGIEGY